MGLPTGFGGRGKGLRFVSDTGDTGKTWDQDTDVPSQGRSSEGDLVVGDLNKTKSENRGERPRNKVGVRTGLV